jgi:hypothetical protein
MIANNIRPVGTGYDRIIGIAILLSKYFEWTARVPDSYFEQS